MISVNPKIGIPTVSFTPTSYKKAYKDFRLGIYRDLIEMMNRAEVDSHVAGCLVGRRAGFQRPFSVTPYSDNASDKERALFIYNVIKNLNYRQMFKDIQEAINKKFSVIDFEWDAVDGKQIPISHKQIEQKYFRFDPKDGILKVDFGKTLIDIPPEVLVCQTEEMPIILPVLRDFILKEFGLESWAGFIEAFGEPLIIGKYPSGADADFKTALETAVNNIARSGRGIMPDGSEIDIKETSKNTGDHEKFVDGANKGIAISILGHANAVESSKGLQVGENMSQYKVRREIAIDDMYFIDSCVQKLIRTIYERNFSDSKFPTFELDKKEPINVKEWLDVLETAYQHSVIIDPSEYGKLGLKIDANQEPIQKQGLSLLD